MRTSNELSTLYKSIDQTKISDSAKETLKKIRLANKNWKGKDENAQELFIEFFNKLKSSKPVAVKTTQEYKDALKKAQIERGKKMRDGKAKPKAPQGAGTEEDANRPAKPFGWRMRGKHNYRKPTRDDISKGRAYYEGRVNRADVKRKKYPMLERGGKLGEKLFSIYPHSVGKAKYVIDVYDGNSTNKDGSPFIGIRTAQNKIQLNSTINLLKEDGFKEVDNVFNYLRKYEDGGYMAKGGEIEVGDLVKHKKYGWIMRVDKIDDGKFYLENDKEGMAISGKAGNNGSYGKSDIEKYKNGGYMAKGGDIDKKRYVKSSYNSNSLIDDKNKASKYFLKDAEYMLKSYGNAKVEKVDNSLPDGVGMNYIVVIDSYKKYAKGGAIEEGDKVIITTDSLGKKYQGMQGEIMSTKLLNDKYSIRLEDGMTMAFDRNEFRHNSINPKYAKGGAIENQYEGRTAEDVWDLWTIEQRSHFLLDHSELLDNDRLENNLGYSRTVQKDKKYSDLTPLTKRVLGAHVKEGQYAKGGYMENGGEVGKSFTILQMNEKLNRMFPDSFGFSVGTFSEEGNKTRNSSALIANENDPFRGLKDSDIDSKLFFPQYKRVHDIRFRIYQGGENTYFHFNLESEKGDEYIGQFGFKDQGDVPSSYITRFIAFLMEQYGLPFEVNHSVMAKGGRIYKDWNGRNTKEMWGKEDLYSKYDNSLDLIADVSDYYKKMGEDINENYAQEQKDDLIKVLQSGKINFNDGATLKFAKGGEVFYTEKHKND